MLLQLVREDKREETGAPKRCGCAGRKR